MLVMGVDDIFKWHCVACNRCMEGEIGHEHCYGRMAANTLVVEAEVSA